MKKIIILIEIFACISTYGSNLGCCKLLSDSIKYDTLFTLQKKNPNQIYTQSMQVLNNTDFENAYYDNFILDSNQVTIANRYYYNDGYKFSLEIERKPMGLETNLLFPAKRYYLSNDNTNTLRGDERYKSYFRINVGDISSKTKYPYLKIKYRTNYVNSFSSSKNHEYIDFLDAFVVYTGSIQILNNSIVKLDKIINTIGVGNFKKISPLADTIQFPDKFDSKRPDNIFSHYIVPTFEIDPNKSNYEQNAENYSFDTLIPLWLNADLKYLDIIIIGSGIIIPEDIKIISIDSFFYSSTEDINFEGKDLKFRNGKFVCDNDKIEITNIKIFDLFGKLLVEGNNDETYKLEHDKLYFVLFNNQFSKKFYITN